MRTTVTLDDDVYNAVQAQAQISGKKMGAVLLQLVRQALQASAQTTIKNGLPVFKVSASSKIIPSSRANELLSEESR